ncbi:MAG: hypothetical protein ACWA49_15560 [Ruegeria sp.]
MTPIPAVAGAWLRDKGAAFVAVSATGFQEADGTVQYKSSIYAEWGMRPSLTIGLDAEEHQNLFGHALVFARVPVADLGKAGHLTAEIGVGTHHRKLHAWAMYKATLSWGKGFQTWGGNGWVVVDTALEDRTHDAVIRKLDLTAGLVSNRLFDPLLQVETSYVPGQPFYWSVRPSVMYRPESGPNTWVFGVEKNASQSTLGLKLSFWQEF